MRPFVVTAVLTINLDLVASWTWGHRSIPERTNPSVLRVALADGDVVELVGVEAGKRFEEEIEAMVRQAAHRERML